MLITGTAQWRLFP